MKQRPVGAIKVTLWNPQARRRDHMIAWLADLTLSLGSYIGMFLLVLWVLSGVLGAPEWLALLGAVAVAWTVSDYAEKLATRITDRLFPVMTMHQDLTLPADMHDHHIKIQVIHKPSDEEDSQLPLFDGEKTWKDA